MPHRKYPHTPIPPTEKPTIHRDRSQDRGRLPIVIIYLLASYVCYEGAMVSHSTHVPIILHTTTKSNCYRLGLVVMMAGGYAPPVAPLAVRSSGVLCWPFDGTA